MEKILIVEDHIDTATTISRILKKYGYVVDMVHDVTAALKVLSIANEYDLLISDIGLPDGSGIDVINQAVHCPQKAIALSGYGGEIDIEKSYEAGFNHHLVKPIDMKILEGKINGLIGGLR